MKKKILIHGCVFTMVICLTASQAVGQKTCQLPKLSNAPETQNIFNESQEMDLGDAVAQHIQHAHRVIDDEAITAYLRRIGERLIKHLPPTNLRFQFFLFDINDVNAFTLPGGRIYVSRKMVAFSQNEDELAGVIAHELGHIIARHSAIDTSILFREVLGVTQVSDRRDIFAKYNQLIENSARKPKAFEKLENHESGNQNVADLIGLYALVQAGYDPDAQASLWDRYFELKGKTGGGFLSDLFGRTKPEQKRLREMLKGLQSLPVECRGEPNAASGSEFRQWQAAVVTNTGHGARKESIPGLASKRELTPYLRSDINQLRFSPDGKFILSQDDSGISVLSREPLKPLFRIDSPDARPARFTPDSRSIVLWTPNLRVELWDVEEQKLKNAYEVVVRKKCVQTSLSPDGKVLACLDGELGLNLFEVETGNAIFEKKSFTQFGFTDLLSMILANLAGDDGGSGEQEIINMVFSPDSHYFVAGDRSVVLGALSVQTNMQTVVFDLTTRKVASVKGDLKEIISSGFAFVGPDKIAGVNFSNSKKSGVYAFPAGESVDKFEIFGRSLWPVTSGNYVMLRRGGKYAGGLLDLATRKIVTINQRQMLDSHDEVMAAELRSGELGLFDLKTTTAKSVALPKSPFGRLYAADVSPDFKWLAVSGYSKGAVWDLVQQKMIFSLRGFRGAFFAEGKAGSPAGQPGNGAGTLYADFPAEGDEARTIAHLNPATRTAQAGAPVENSSARQLGKFVIQFNPAKKNGSYWEDVVMEVRDASTMSQLWSLPFPNERPRYGVAPRDGTISLLWPLSSKAAAAAIKLNPTLTQQLKTLQEKAGDYYLKVLDLNSGKPLGELLIETGRGSFRISDVFTTGDWVAISDTENRTLVYSLSNGQQKAKVFGRLAAVSSASNLLCVETGEGPLTLHSLAPFEQLEQFTFPTRVSFVRFSEDGKRLFVLTADQTVYLLDLSKFPAKSQPA